MVPTVEERLRVRYGSDVIVDTSYGTDEPHQLETARLRVRSLDTTHIRPVSDPAQLPAVLSNGARTVREQRRPVLVDVCCSE